jgi:hypothetical protein
MKWRERPLPRAWSGDRERCRDVSCVAMIVLAVSGLAVPAVVIVAALVLLAILLRSA